MKLKLFFITSLLFSIYITGCARNNATNNDIAYRNINKQTRVDYNTPNRTPRVTDVNDRNNNLDINQPNRNLPGTNNNRGIVANNNKMSVADQAAKKVADLSEVDTANIIVTNNNAYAAVKLNSNRKLTNNLESKISSRIKSVDRGIDHVYVSANPDFYQHMQDYANNIRNGKPVTGFFNEFNQTIQRVFPDEK